MKQIPAAQLKELLMEEGLVAPENFDAAAKDAERIGQDVVSLLISRGVITRDYFYNILTKFLGVEKAGLASGQVIDEGVMRLLPEPLAHEKRAIVFARPSEGVFSVAMEDPSDLQIIDFLKKYLKGEVQPFLATDDDLNKGFKLYSQRSAEDFKLVIEENIQKSLQMRVSAEEAAAELPIVSIVDTVLSYAVTSRASDVHLEVLETNFLIRFRIDGILHEILQVPKEVHPAIVARIKILSSLKLDEHMKPQDGRFRYRAGEEMIDARVSVIPTLYGEKVVLRILPAAQRPLAFEELGLLEDQIALLKENLKKAYGMVLVTGPTGSGKTTTLYAMINYLNKPEVNIVTIEDPIEFGISNVNQTQINPDAGLSFASGLRALVRQDPNVIMIGEIRDRETADIAIHSALTGSVVLSTLHTNNASGAIPRLLDIGMEPFLVAAVLNLIMAQRLVRRICLDCIVSYKPDTMAVETVRAQFKIMGIEDSFKAPKMLYKGKGCNACGHIGYRGRVGIYEFLRATEKLQKLMVSPDFSLSELAAQARRDGMITMFEDGFRKAERGLTTIDEVLRVIRE